ncbi:50S ribosomal protein L40e [Candidatus Woesearchaeota archaeon]|nr:50S ribosomal protein L40e [Candidatus Woesearchaeota archaeon]
MVKFPQAEARFFHNIFVCKKCGSKIRANNMKVIAGKVHCRKCQSVALRPKRRK